MVVAWALVGLRMEGIRSLKEKRHALRGVIERIGRSPMVSIAEVGDQNLWANAEIGVAAIGVPALQAEALVQKAVATLEEQTGWEVVSVQRGVERVA